MLRAGQKVVCVDASLRPESWVPPSGETGLVKGAIYTIADSIVNRVGVPCVRVREVNPRGMFGYFADRFRPVTDISELEKLLIQAPVKVKESV